MDFIIFSYLLDQFEIINFLKEKKDIKILLMPLILFNYRKEKDTQKANYFYRILIK